MLYAGEGWGKTSFAAQMPKPIFVQTRGETGLETLIDAGRLGEVPHFPEVHDWQTLVAAIQWLRDTEHGYRTIVIDTLNGAERLLHEMVCHRDYSGDWGDRGFGSYQKGFEVSLADLNLMLSALDSLRLDKRMTVVWLAHRRILLALRRHGLREPGRRRRRPRAAGGEQGPALELTIPHRCHGHPIHGAAASPLPPELAGRPRAVRRREAGRAQRLHGRRDRGALVERRRH